MGSVVPAPPTNGVYVKFPAPVWRGAPLGLDIVGLAVLVTISGPKFKPVGSCTKVAVTILLGLEAEVVESVAAEFLSVKRRI